MGQNFWVSSNARGITERDITFDASSMIKPKRAYQLFMDTYTEEILCNKKQAIEHVASGQTSAISNAPAFQRGNECSIQSVTNRLFGSEIVMTIDHVDKGIHVAGTGNSNFGRKDYWGQFGSNSSIGLSMSHAMEDRSSNLNYGGIGNVKVNGVGDSENGMFFSMGSSCRMGDNNTDSTATASNKIGGNNISLDRPYSSGNDNIISMNPDSGNASISLIPMGQTFNKQNGSFLLMGHTINMENSIVEPVDITSSPENSIHYNTTPGATDAPPTTSKTRKKKPPKPRKVVANNFPANVKSLLSTGVLNGVPIKYVSWSREQNLKGILNEAGYLCGCKDCKYSKALTAFQFESHAGCKTKHPNDHIYFENGKSIYSVVQELQSTPPDMMFEMIKTVTGSPINLKNFLAWKASYEETTRRELQSTHGDNEAIIPNNQ